MVVDKDVKSDPNADNALLWNLLLLSEVLRIDGAPFVAYAADFEAVLNQTLHMTNTFAHAFACSILERYMKTITSIFPINFCSVQTSLDLPVTDYLPIRVRMLLPSLCGLCAMW